MLFIDVKPSYSAINSFNCFLPFLLIFLPGAFTPTSIINSAPFKNAFTQAFTGGPQVMASVSQIGLSTFTLFNKAENSSTQSCLSHCPSGPLMWCMFAISKLSLIFSYFPLKKFKSKLDPRKYNGAVFLGLNGIAVKSHGSTDSFGFANAIGVAADMSKYGFLDKYIIKFIMWITNGPTDTTKSYEFTAWDRVDAFAKKLVA